MKNSSSLEPKGRWPWKLICSIGYLSTSKLVQIMTGLTLTYFMARSSFVPYAFVWDDSKTMDFSEAIVVYDIKIGRFSKLNEYMKLMSTKGQGHLLTWSKSLRFNIFKLLFINNHKADWSQISCGASLGWGNESLFKWSRSHDQGGHHAHIW